MSASPWVIAHADRPVEPEVREPGQPGERRPGDVEVRARHPALPVHVRGVERPVRVVADHGPAMRGPPPADRPRVGPGLDLGEEPQVPVDVAERRRRAAGDTGAQPPSGGTASGDPSGGRVSSRANASGPIRASSTAFTSLCCHCPISTCRTRNAATECHGRHGSTRYRRGSGSAPSAIAAFTPSAYASNAARSRRRHRGDVAAGPRRPAAAAAPARPRRRAATPGDLRPPPARPPPVVVHLEQPVLRARVPHPGPRRPPRVSPRTCGTP